jgi:hypothetical protein
MADILLILFLLAITGGFIALYHRSEKEARAKLGDAVEIQLYRKWGVLFQRVLIAMAILLPLAFGTMAVVRHWGFDAMYISFLRSFWMLSMVYGIRRSGVLLIGERGMFAAGMDMIPWKDILRIDWDRDIGQQQWGVSLVIRKKRREEKRRLYIHREKKGEVERAIERFRPEQEKIAEQVAH